MEALVSSLTAEHTHTLIPGHARALGSVSVALVDAVHWWSAHSAQFGEQQDLVRVKLTRAVWRKVFREIGRLGSRKNFSTFPRVM